MTILLESTNLATNAKIIGTNYVAMYSLKLNKIQNLGIAIYSYLVIIYLPVHQYVMICFGHPVYFCLQFLSGQWISELKQFYLNKPS